MPNNLQSERREPILNPNGQNKAETEEVIRTLSTALNSTIAGDYAAKVIDAVRRGYEEQTGRKYDSFLPKGIER